MEPGAEHADYWAAPPARGAPETPEVGPNGFAVAPPAPSGVPHHHGSRWKGDTVTLNTWWRLVVTGLLLLPVLWMIFFMGIGGVLFLGLYVFLVLPVALRDVWRRTRISLPPLPPETRRT
jgi:hypothetical protein